MDHVHMLSWAHRKLQALSTAIETVYQNQPTAFWPEHNRIAAETFETTLYLMRRDVPGKDDWPFLIGEAAHALRISLDYLAARLVPGPLTAKQRENVGFPIRGERTNYGGIEGSRLPGVHPTARHLIKQFQPKFGPHAPSYQPLLILDELDNIHKHRRLLLTDLRLSGVRVIGDCDCAAITSLSSAGPLEERTEVCRYVVLDKAAHRPDHMRIAVTTHVCFEEAGALEGLKVMAALGSIYDHIKDAIFPELEPYMPPVAHR